MTSRSIYILTIKMPAKLPFAFFYFISMSIYLALIEQGGDTSNYQFDSYLSPLNIVSLSVGSIAQTIKLT